MRRHAVAAAILSATAAGCTPPALPPASNDPRVSVAPDAHVFADPPIVVAAPLLRASVRLVNPAAADAPLIETTDWANAAGLPVRSLLSRPQRLTVPRYGTATVAIIAPNPAATQFQIRIEPDLPAP